MSHLLLSCLFSSMKCFYLLVYLLDTVIANHLSSKSIVHKKGIKCDLVLKIPSINRCVTKSSVYDLVVCQLRKECSMQRTIDSLPCIFKRRLLCVWRFVFLFFLDWWILISIRLLLIFLLFRLFNHLFHLFIHLNSTANNTFGFASSCNKPFLVPRSRQVLCFSLFTLVFHCVFVHGLSKSWGQINLWYKKKLFLLLVCNCILKLSTCFNKRSDVAYHRIKRHIVKNIFPSLKCLPCFSHLLAEECFRAVWP